MANPYTLTYKFGQALDVGESVAGNHLIRMTMEFTVNDDGTDDEIFAGDVGLKIIDWGELRWEREIDENLLVPGKFSFELFDGEAELWELLFEGALAPVVAKDAKVTLEIKYSGDANYTVEYIGNVDNTEIRYDKLNKRLSLICVPKTDKFKTLYLYEESEDGTRLVGLNPLSLTYSILADIYIADPVNVKTLIHEIFKQIDSSCTLEWQHNWLFLGENNLVSPTTYDEFNLDDLTFGTNYLSALFFSIENPYQIETLYDLLIKYAFSFGFICGMITSEKAFVKEIFYYNPSNTQTLGTIKKHTIANKYGDIEAVRISMRQYERVGATKKNAYQEKRATYSIVPPGSKLRGDAIIDEEIPVFGKYALLGSSGDLTGVYNTNTYTIYNVKPPVFSSFVGFDESLAVFYYNMRNRHKLYSIAGNPVPAGVETSIGREDEFIVEGIKYDYMKDFAYDGNGYQIISLIKRLSKNESTINALLVTDAMDEETPDTGTPPPKPFENVLPGGYLKDYSYNCEIAPADINASLTVDLFTIPAGFELKKIIIKINTKFDTVLTMKIQDDDGDLITNDRINNEDDEVIESYQYKNYAAQKTIQAVFTKSGTVTAGDADIILELRTRL